MSRVSEPLPATVKEWELPRSPSWLETLRLAAWSRFQELGLPTTKHEEWKYTNVTPLARWRLGRPRRQLERAAELLERSWAGPGWRVVLVDGEYEPSLSRPGASSGISIVDLATAIEAGWQGVREQLGQHASFQDHPFVAWNTAVFAGGVFLEVPPGMVVEEPIWIIHISTGGEQPVVSHPRILIVAGRASQCSVVEEYLGPASETYLTNAVTEVVAGDGAIVEHCKIEREGSGAWHLATIWGRAARDSHFYSHVVGLGSKLSRHDVVVVLDGPGAEGMLNGLYVVTGDRHADYHTLLDHAQPRGQSRELYKGILSGAATGAFNGKIRVRPGAQKTDAIQHNHNLLLSRDATINSKPQLEILADDVRCTHGATVGQIEEGQVFYLRSRGLSVAEARAMLLVAFAGDVLERIGVEQAREAIQEFVKEVASIP